MDKTMCIGMPTRVYVYIIHIGIDGNRRLNFFCHGHHGQTSFVGGGFFSFILYIIRARARVVFSPFFSSRNNNLTRMRTRYYMYVRYGPTQPSFTNNISIPRVYGVRRLYARSSGRRRRLP